MNGHQRHLQRVAIGLCLALVLAAAVRADTFRWNATGGGDWNNAASWTLISGSSGRTYPNDSTDIAQFYNSIAADSLVNVNGTYTVKEIYFDLTSYRYTLGGTGQINSPLETAGTYLDVYVNNASTQEIAATIGMPRWRGMRPLPTNGATLILSGALLRYGGAAAGFSIDRNNNTTGVVLYRVPSASPIDGLTSRNNGGFGIGVSGSLGTTNGGSPVQLQITGAGSFFADAADRSVSNGVYLNNGGHFNGGHFNGGNGYNLALAGSSKLGDTSYGHTSYYNGPGVLTFNGPVTFAANHTLRTDGGSAKVVFNGTGSVVATGSNSGSTVNFRDALTVGIGNDNAFGAGALRLTSSGPVFTAEGGAHAIVNDINLQSYTLVVDGANSLGLSGAISGTGGKITKQGSGTLTLANANSYTGTTAISGGTLLVNGTHTGGDSYTVGAGGTLGGTGIIDPAATKTVTVGGSAGSYAAISPGASIGTLTIGASGSPNDVTLGDYSTLVIETDWASSDQLLVYGNLSFTGTHHRLIVNGYGAPFAGDIVQTLGAGTITPSSFAEIIWGGVLTGGTVTFNGTSISITTIPEPAAAALLALAAAAMVRRRGHGAARRTR